MTAGRRERASASATTTASAVNPDVVYCNTWAYGLEGPLAHFGGLDPLYQAAAGLEYEAGAVHHGQRAALLPLRDVRRRQRDALGRRLLAALVPPATAPARARSCGRRCSTAARCPRPTRCSSTATPCRRPRLDQGQHGIDAVLPPLRDAGRLDPDRRGAARGAGRAARRGAELDADADEADLRDQSSLTKTSLQWRGAPRRRRRAERDPVRRDGRRARALRRRQRSGSGSSPSTSTRSWARCASSASS